MLGAVCFDLKWSGLYNITYKPDIHGDEVMRLKDYFSGCDENYVILQRMFWF